MKDTAHLLPRISVERLRDELFKILAGPKPDASLRALEMLGIFPYLLPELPALKGVTQTAPHIYDVWEHTLKVLGYLENILATLAPGYSADDTKDLFTGLLTLRIGRFREQFAAHFADSLNTDRSVRAALFFAALYHDVEKPSTKSIDEEGRIHFYEHDIKGADTAARRAEAFNLSNDETRRIHAGLPAGARIDAVQRLSSLDEDERVCALAYLLFAVTEMIWSIFQRDCDGNTSPHPNGLSSILTLLRNNQQ